MYAKDMFAVATTRIGRSTDQMDLGPELDGGLDDRIEAAYAIVELGERGSNKGGVQSPSTEAEEELDDDADQYHQVPRSPECRRYHFDHSTDTSPARTPTTTVECPQPRVAHIRGAVMPSRTIEKPVCPKRRMVDDEEEGIKAKLARMLAGRKNPQGESQRVTSQDGNDTTGQNDEMEIEELGGKFVRTSVALVESKPFSQLPTKFEPKGNFPERLEIKSEQVYLDNEVKNFQDSVWNKRGHLPESVPAGRSVAEDFKSKFAAHDLINSVSVSNLPSLSKKLNISDVETKESSSVKAVDVANLAQLLMERRRTGFLRMEPPMLGVFPAWSVQNYSPQFLFLSSLKEIQPDADNRLWRYDIFPTANSSNVPAGRVIPEFLRSAEVHDSPEVQQMVPSCLREQTCRSPARRADLESVETRPLYHQPSLTRSHYPQFGSLSSLNKYYSTAVSETANYPSHLIESKTHDDLKSNSHDSPKSSNHQNTEQSVLPPRSEVHSNKHQRPQSNGNKQNGSRAHQPDSLRVHPRVSKSRRKISAIAQAMAVVNGGEFGSLKTLRKFYSSLKSGQKPESSAQFQVGEISNSRDHLSSMQEVEFQDFPLDLSRCRRRLSRELRTDVKYFPSLPEISCEVSGKLQDNSFSRSDSNGRVLAYPYSRQQNLKVPGSPVTTSHDVLAGPPANGDRGNGDINLASSVSSCLPNSHLPPKKRKIRQLSQSLDLPEMKTTNSSPVSTTSFHESPDNALNSEHAGERELPTSRTIQQIDSNVKTSSAETRMSLTAEPQLIHGKVTEETSLLSAVAVRDEDGDLPIHIAVAQGSVGVVRKLLPMMSQLGISVNTCNNNRQTALHLAVISNQPHMVELLLQSLASPNACDRKGNTSVHLAVKYKTPTCLKHILTNSRIPPDLNAKNYEGLTALHIGVQMSQMETVKALLANGADGNVTDGTNGRTPLFYAVEANDYAVASVLLRHGSDPCIASYSGCTPLQIATTKSFRDVASILERSSLRGCDAAFSCA